jgi:HlyD family secretion protein
MTTAAKKKRKKWPYVVAILVLIALLALAAVKGRNSDSGLKVETDEVALRTIIEKVSASGKIFPETEVKISSDVSGEIVELYVEEGDSVTQGQILARIDPEVFASAVERGKANVNNAKAQQAMSEANIASAEAQLAQIEAQLDNARLIHQRNEQLRDQKVISQQDYEQSQATLDGLIANKAAANASIRSSAKSAEAAAYSVKVAEANFKELNTNLKRTTIKAPVNGIVSSLSVEQGERVVGTIQMTGTEMMRIANLNTMEVQVEVSENDILSVELGDHVEIEVDAYLDKTFTGKVTEIANSASNISSVGQVSLNSDQVTNFVVKVRMDKPSYDTGQRYPFRPGMSASVDIFTTEEKDVLSVPIQAVTVRDLNKDDKENDEEDIQEVVFVVAADTAQQVVVTTGIQDDEYILIKSGLDKGTKVITGPYSAVSKKLASGTELNVKDNDEGDED